MISCSSQSFLEAHNRQIRLFPSTISSWILSLEVAISACADRTEQRKVASVPPMAAKNAQPREHWADLKGAASGPQNKVTLSEPQPTGYTIRPTISSRPGGRGGARIRKWDYWFHYRNIFIKIGRLEHVASTLVKIPSIPWLTDIWFVITAKIKFVLTFHTSCVLL